MNKTPKEKSVQILIRAKPKEKEKIKSIAMKCNLHDNEYMLQRALGYETRELNPDAFYVFYEKLCELCNADDLLLPATQSALLELLDRIHSELLLPGKEDLKKCQPQDSGPLNLD